MVRGRRIAGSGSLPSPEDAEGAEDAGDACHLEMATHQVILRYDVRSESRGNMKAKKILSSGEFAELCQTTKATLFHYERLGLLRPRHVAATGYRGYGIEQFFDFDAIAMFKETGSSLREIEEMRRNEDEAGLLDILEKKRQILRREKERLARREAMLEDMITDLRHARGLSFDCFFVEEQEAETLEMEPADTGIRCTEAECVAQYAAYIAALWKKRHVPRAPFGVLLDSAILEGGPYREMAYFSRATAHTPPACRHSKEEGRYLVMAHKGDYASHLRSLERMANWMKENECRPSGMLYGCSMLSGPIGDMGNCFVVRYCVRVLEE